MANPGYTKPASYAKSGKRGIQLAGVMQQAAPQAQAIDDAAIRRKAMIDALDANSDPIVTGGSGFDDWGQIASHFGKAFFDARSAKDTRRSEEETRRLALVNAAEDRALKNRLAEHELNAPMDVAAGHSLVNLTTGETVASVDSPDRYAPVSSYDNVGSLNTRTGDVQLQHVAPRPVGGGGHHTITHPAQLYGGQ